MAQLVDAMVFAAAIVQQTFGLRRERDAALEAELAASQAQLELSQSLLAAQSERDKARRLADRRREVDDAQLRFLCRQLEEGACAGV